MASKNVQIKWPPRAGQRSGKGEPGGHEVSELLGKTNMLPYQSGAFSIVKTNLFIKILNTITSLFYLSNLFFKWSVFLKEQCPKKHMVFFLIK